MFETSWRFFSWNLLNIIYWISEVCRIICSLKAFCWYPGPTWTFPQYLDIWPILSGLEVQIVPWTVAIKKDTNPTPCFVLRTRRKGSGKHKIERDHYGLVLGNKVSPRTQKQHLFLAVGMVEVDRRIRLAAVRHVWERYICRYESNFNLNFLNTSAHNEACLRQTLKHASYATSVHPHLPPFPSGSSPSATPSTSISWKFQPTTKHVWD